MTTLVTGGAGFIGSHLTESLLGSGEDVIILDDLSTGQRAEPRRGTGSSVGSARQGLDPGRVPGGRARRPGRHRLPSRRGGGDLHHPRQDAGQPAHEPARDGERRRERAPAWRARSRRLDQRGVRQEHQDRAAGGRRPRDGLAAEAAVGLRRGQGDRRDPRLRATWHEHGLPVVVARLFNTVGPRQTGRYGMVIPRFVGQGAGRPADHRVRRWPAECAASATSHDVVPRPDWR